MGVKRRVLGVALAAAMASLPVIGARADDPIRIGFLSTFSGPEGVLGNELADGWKLALAETGNRLGGRPVQMTYGDDQAKTDIAREVADKMIDRDHIQLLTGMNFSNVLLAVAKPMLDSGGFIVSPNAGPSQLAGKGCEPHFFAASFQNDTLFEAIGLYLNEKKIDGVYLLSPNYPGGHDLLEGFKRTYKGTVTAETYTQFGALDYSGVISEIRAKAPKAVVFFYPGGMGVNFVKQYAAAGLKEQIPLYTGHGNIDQTVLPALGEAARGVNGVVLWSEGLTNPANVAFVADFQKTYHRIPSPYAALAYDTARLLDAALGSIGGLIEDKPAFQKAMETVHFDSVRGFFRFNNNHYPLQNFYSTVVGDNKNGQLAALLTGTVATDVGDRYAAECKMPKSGG